MSEDWLELPAPSPDDIGPQAKVEDAPPATAGLPAVVGIPDDFTARLALIDSCWSKLTDKQRMFLTAWRDHRYNVSAASRALGGSTHRVTHGRWMQDPNYATVVRLWRGVASQRALDRDRLLARQDDIVETLLTPKPVLYMGAPTGIEEVEAAAAARANETLMKAAGLLKDKDVEVNVGIALSDGPPTLNIQVIPLPPKKAVEDQGVVIDAKFTEVPSDGWLDT